MCRDYSKKTLSPDAPVKRKSTQRSGRGLLEQGGTLGFLKSLRGGDLMAPSAPARPWPVDQPANLSLRDLGFSPLSK